MLKRTSQLIAVCGIDGAGKSTLIDMLEDDLGQKDILFIRKKIRTNSDLVKRFHNGLLETELDCSYSRANAFACALDFMAHYHETIEPILFDGRIIVCDRYKPCYLAYGFVVRTVHKDIPDLLKNIPEADYVFYIDARIDLVIKRLASKGEKRTRSLLEAFAKAHEQILGTQKNVIRILNNGEIREAYQEFKENILKIMH